MNVDENIPSDGWLRPDPQPRRYQQPQPPNVYQPQTYAPPTYPPLLPQNHIDENIPSDGWLRLDPQPQQYRPVVQYLPPPYPPPVAQTHNYAALPYPPPNPYQYPPMPQPYPPYHAQPLSWPPAQPGHLPPKTVLNPKLTSGPSSKQYTWMRPDHDANPPSSSSFTVPIPTAPDIPAAIRDKLKHGHGHAKIRAQLSRVDAEDQAAVQAKQLELLQICQVVLDRMNPHTRRHREGILFTWGLTLQSVAPELHQDLYWSPEVVMKYARFYLRWRVDSTPGRRAPRVKASTVLGWLTHFVYCIVKYTRDPVTKASEGVRVLVNGGMFVQLEQEAAQIIDDYKLDRSLDEKHYFGRHELQIMIVEALRRSRGAGRLVKMQTVIAILFPFYLSVRPGSLAPSATEFLEGGKYLQLEHLRLFILADGSFEVRVEIKNFKGYNDVRAHNSKFIISPVKMAHNLLFDLPMWLVAYLCLRGCFFQKTMDDIYKLQNFELKILPDKLSEPLFLASSPGGRKLLSQPVSARHLSESVCNLTLGTGLPTGGIACIRRDTGNDYGNKLGRDTAQLVLAHRQAGTIFDTHYSRGTENLAVTGIRLGEIDINEGDHIKAGVNAQLIYSAAVAAMVYQKGRAKLQYDSEGELAPKAPPMELSEDSKSDPAYIKLTDEWDTAWAEFKACYSDGVKDYVHILQNISIIAKSKAVKLLHPEKLTDVVKTLRDVGKRRNSRIQYLKRIQRKRMTKQAAAEVVATSDTIQARLQAAKEINAPPSMLLTLAAEVAQVIGSPKTLPSIAPRPSPVTPLATDEPAPSLEGGALDADLDRWLSQLNGNAPGAPGMVEEGDTEEEDAVERDLTDSMLLQTLQRQARDTQGDVDHTKKGKRKRNPAKKDKGKGKARAELSRPHSPHSNEDEENPEAHSPMTLVNWDPADTIAATGITQERDVLQLPVNDIRRVLIQFIIQPVLNERIEQEQFISDGNKWKCQSCKKYLHRPEMANTNYSSKPSRDRHTGRMHDEWQDLELQMLGPIPGEYHCPSEDFNASTVEDVLEHCLSDSCIDHDRYIAMQEASTARISSIKRQDNRQMCDRRKIKAKLRMANTAVDSDVSEEGEVTAVDSDVSEESEVDSTAEMMEKFSQLHADGIYAAAAKHSVPYDDGTSRSHLEDMIEITSTYKTSTLKSGVHPGAWDALLTNVAELGRVEE